MTSTATPLAKREFLIGLAIAMLGATLFSAKAIFAKLIYRFDVDAVTLLGFRMIFSAPFFVAAALWIGHNAKPLSAGDRLRVVLLGLIGYYLSSYFSFIGLQYISTGLERLILFLTPSFVLLLSVFFLKKRIGLIELLALAISYSGAVLVFVHDVRLGGDNVVMGSAFILGSALSYAVYLIMSGQLVRRIGAMRLVAYAMCVASVACILQFYLLRGPGYLVQPTPVYLLSIGNAVLSTVLPVFITMIAVDRIGAPSTAQAGMIGPVSILVMGSLILDEPVTAIQLVGTALVLAGIYLLSKKKT